MRKRHMRVPELVSYQGVTDTPEHWAEMIGVSLYSYYKVANELGSFERACDLQHYEMCTEINCVNCEVCGYEH